MMNLEETIEKFATSSSGQHQMARPEWNLKVSCNILDDISVIFMTLWFVESGREIEIFEVSFIHFFAFGLPFIMNTNINDSALTA